MKMRKKCMIFGAVILAVLFLAVLVWVLSSAKASKLRRPISPKQPMWLVHIDSWNLADPQKIIDLIPEDIRPYVVFNISMSVFWDTNEKVWRMVHDGYETAK